MVVQNLGVLTPLTPGKAPPVVATTKGSNYDIAFEITSGFEGGEVNDPDDPGGHTKYGVSKRAYPNEDIANMTIERAKYLAKRDRWFPMRLDSLNSQMISNNLFDFAYHHGVRGTVKKLQIVLAREFNFDGIIDGILGSKTLDYMNSVINSGQGAPFALHQCLVACRLKYYLATAKPKYLKGFVARATHFL